MDEKLLITIDEAAELLSIGRSSMYQHVLKRELPTVRLGRSVRIAVADLRRFVEELEDDAAGAMKRVG